LVLNQIHSVMQNLVQNRSRQRPEAVPTRVLFADMQSAQKHGETRSGSFTKAAPEAMRRGRI
jgi:hypothetical protein